MSITFPDAYGGRTCQPLCGCCCPRPLRARLASIEPPPAARQGLIARHNCSNAAAVSPTECSAEFAGGASSTSPPRGPAKVLQLEAPITLPSTQRMPVRFVISQVVISHGLYSMILEGQDGGGASVRLPLPMPVPLEPETRLHPPWNVQDTSSRDGDIVAPYDGDYNSTPAVLGFTVLGARGPFEILSVGDHRPDDKPLPKPRKQQQQQRQAARALGVSTPGVTRLPRSCKSPSLRNGIHDGAATVAAVLASAVAGMAAAESSGAEGPTAAPLTGATALPTAASAQGGPVVAGMTGAEAAAWKLPCIPPPATAPVVTCRSSHDSMLSAAAALLAVKQLSAASSRSSTASSAASTSAPEAAAAILASGTAVHGGPSRRLAGPVGHQDRSNAQAPAYATDLASKVAPFLAPAPAPVSSAASVAASAPAATAAALKAFSRTQGGGGGARQGPPLLSRPDATSASRLLARFNPTTLVRRSGTVCVETPGEEGLRRKPPAPFPPSSSRPMDSPSANAPSTSRGPTPQARLAAASAARPLPALLYLLRTGALPPLHASTDRPGSGARRVNGRRVDLDGDGGGADGRAGLRHGPKPRRPAAFRPSVLVSRAGKASVRPPSGAVDAERWGFLVGDGPWSEAAAASEIGAGSSQSGGQKSGVPSLLQVLREADPSAVVRQLAWAASGHTAVPAEAAVGTLLSAPGEPAFKVAVPLCDKRSIPVVAATSRPDDGTTTLAPDGVPLDTAGIVALKQRDRRTVSAAGLAAAQPQMEESRMQATDQAMAGRIGSWMETAGSPTAATTQTPRWQRQPQDDDDAQLRLVRALRDVASLKGLAAILDEHLDAMGAIAVAAACRTVITLVQTAGGAAGREPAWCGASAPNLHCQHGALEYLGKPYGPRAAPGLGMRGSGGAAGSALAVLGGSGCGQQGCGDGVGREAAAVAAAAAAGRRLVGRLARRAIKVAAAAAAATAAAAAAVEAAGDEATLGESAPAPETSGQAAAAAAAVTTAAEENVGAGGWPEVEAALAVLWAYGHLAEAEDQLDLDLQQDLGLNLGPSSGPRMGPGLGLDASMTSAAADPTGAVHGGDVDAGPVGQQARGDALQRPAKAGRDGLLAAAKAQAPFRTVMGQLWRVLLLSTLQAWWGPRRQGPPVPGQRWASWALWAAARGAPGLVPAALMALAKAPRGVEGAAASDVGQGVHEKNKQGNADGARSSGEEAAEESWPGLRRLPFRRLVGVLWGCSRYAEWAAVRKQEMRAMRFRRGWRRGAARPTPGDRLASSVATVALRLLHPHVSHTAEQLRHSAQRAVESEEAAGAVPPWDLSRHDLLTALAGAAAVLDRATVEREVLALLYAVSDSPAVRLEDVIAGLTILHTWLPATTAPRDDEGKGRQQEHDQVQQNEEQRQQQQQKQHGQPPLFGDQPSLLAARRKGAYGPKVPMAEPHAAAVTKQARAQIGMAEVGLQEPPQHVARAAPTAIATAIATAIGDPALPSSALRADLRGLGLPAARTGAAAPSEAVAVFAGAPLRRAVQLQLEAAVLRLVGGMSAEQAQEQLAVISLGRAGVSRWRRGWYRRVALPPYVPPGQQQPLLPTREPGSQPGHQGPGGAEGAHASPQRRGWGLNAAAANIRASRRRGALVRCIQHPMPFRLRLLYKMDPAEGMGILDAAAAADTGAAGKPPAATKLPTSLELQLRHQRRLCDGTAVRQYGTRQLLELLGSLGAGVRYGDAAAAGRPRPVTVRCVLNALALRWLHRGVAAADLRALLPALAALRWQPRATLAIFTVAWRPFVVLDPGTVGDAALAGMAQVLGRLASHNAPRRSFRRTRGPPRPAPEAAAAAAGGAALSVPWPRIRRFWTNVIALATARVNTAGLRHFTPGACEVSPGQMQQPTAPTRTKQPAAAAVPLSYASLVRLVWSSARQGARVAPFMGLACRVLQPVLRRLPPQWVSALAWGLGQPRFVEPRMKEALLAWLRRWMEQSTGLELEGNNWTPACRVAWALLRLRVLSATSPELEELLVRVAGDLRHETDRPASRRPRGQQRPKRKPNDGSSYRLRTGPRSRPVVNPRALATLLWAIYAEGKTSMSGNSSSSGRDPAGGIMAGAAGGAVSSGGVSQPRRRIGRVEPDPVPDLLERQAEVFRSIASYLARYTFDLSPSALLQMLEVMAFGSTHSSLRCRAFLEAFSLVLERRPKWLLHSQVQVRLVQECFRRLDWWPATQVEELASRGLELSLLPQPRPLRRW